MHGKARMKDKRRSRKSGVCKRRMKWAVCVDCGDAVKPSRKRKGREIKNEGGCKKKKSHRVWLLFSKTNVRCRSDATKRGRSATTSSHIKNWLSEEREGVAMPPLCAGKTRSRAQLYVHICLMGVVVFPENEVYLSCKRSERRLCHLKFEPFLYGVDMVPYSMYLASLDAHSTLATLLLFYSQQQ